MPQVFEGSRVFVVELIGLEFQNWSQRAEFCVRVAQEKGSVDAGAQVWMGKADDRAVQAIRWMGCLERLVTQPDCTQ